MQLRDQAGEPRAAARLSNRNMEIAVGDEKAALRSRIRDAVGTRADPVQLVQASFRNSASRHGGRLGLDELAHRKNVGNVLKSHGRNDMTAPWDALHPSVLAKTRKRMANGCLADLVTSR